MLKRKGLYLYIHNHGDLKNNYVCIHNNSNYCK